MHSDYRDKPTYTLILSDDTMEYGKLFQIAIVCEKKEK